MSSRSTIRSLFWRLCASATLLAPDPASAHAYVDSSTPADRSTLPQAPTAKLRGEDSARRIQLALEYDPAPPFTSGSPERADPAAVEDVRQRRAPVIKAAEAAARRAAERLRP